MRWKRIGTVVLLGAGLWPTCAAGSVRGTAERAVVSKAGDRYDAVVAATPEASAKCQRTDVRRYRCEFRLQDSEAALIGSATVRIAKSRSGKRRVVVRLGKARLDPGYEPKPALPKAPLAPPVVTGDSIIAEVKRVVNVRVPGVAVTDICPSDVLPSSTFAAGRSVTCDYLYFRLAAPYDSGSGKVVMTVTPQGQLTSQDQPNPAPVPPPSASGGSYSGGSTYIPGTYVPGFYVPGEYIPGLGHVPGEYVPGEYIPGGYCC